MKRKLTFNELEYVQKEVKLKGKSTVMSYILAILLGMLGIHLGYLERVKSAIVRFLLTTSTAVLFFLAFSAVEVLDVSELTMRLQQYSSALSVALAIAIITQVIWTMYDLVTIPKWVREINDKIEGKATTSIIQSSYAAEEIRKEETSNIVVDKVIELTELKIQDEIDNKIKSSKEKVNSINNELLERELEINKLTKKLDLDIETVDNLSSQLSNSVNEIQKYMVREIGDLKTSIKRELESVSAKTVDKLETDDKLNDEERADELNENKNDDNTEHDEDNSQIETPNDSEINDPDVETVDNFNSTVELHENSEEENEVEEDLKNETEEIEKDEKSSESASNSISVQDALNSDGIVQVEGYIIGSMNSDGELEESNFKDDSNLVISDNTESSNEFLVIQISKKSNLRGKFGLKSSPENIGKKVAVSGRRTKYFKKDGMKNINKLRFID